MSISANVAARKSAETVCELINGELKTLIDKFGQQALPPFFEQLRLVYGKNLAVATSAPATVRAPRGQIRPSGDPAGDALELIDEALELVERMPERGQEYAESAAENLNGIADTIERKNEVTPGQLAAIENIKAGLERWVR